MNRLEEYNALMQELEETPAQLNFTVARAKARSKKQKARRLIGAPLSSLAAVCAVFVLLVNVSAPFAMACSNVPILKELVDTLCFNPSLIAAVENDWVQPIGQTERDGEYAMTVEYLIVDQKQLNVFYRLEGGSVIDPEDRYMLRPEFLDAQGEHIKASVVTGGSRIDGELYRITVDFTSSVDTMPGQLRLECTLNRAWDDSENGQLDGSVADFTFDLTFDPKFTAQATVLELDRWLELDGQRVLLKTVEIYPTHMRVELEDAPDNTAWLRGLTLYVENEDGDSFGSISNGISATGSPDSPFMTGFRLESSFFSDSGGLTLCISGAEWLEKEKQWAFVDLASVEATGLPDAGRLQKVERDGGKLTMTFQFPDTGDYSQKLTGWRAPDGTEGYFDGWSGYTHGEQDENAGYYENYSQVEDYTWDTIELALDHSLVCIYDEAVRIPLF